MREERAAEGGERGARHRDAQLLSQDVDADRGRGTLVLGDRLERRPAHAAIDPVPDDDADHPDDERDGIEIGLVGELQRVPGMPDRLRRHAERAARNVARGDDDQKHDLAECQGDEGEIVADDTEAEAGIADYQRQQRGEHDAERDAEPGRYLPVIPQQRRDIGADAEKGAVAERDEAEFPHQRP